MSEGLQQLGPSQWCVPGDRSETKLHFLGFLQDFLTLKQLPALCSQQQLDQILLSITYRCKMQGNVVLPYGPWAELLCWMLHLPPPAGKPEGSPRNSTVTHSPVLHWDMVCLHAVWLLRGWERVWMRFIHCNQNPTSTGRKFKCM